MRPFNANKGLRKLNQKKHLGAYIKYGTFVVSLLLFVATVIYLTRAEYTSRHDFELINAKVGEFTLDIDINLNTDGGESSTYLIHSRRKQPIGVLPEPVKLGYAFTGWYTTPTFEDGSGVNSQTIVTKGLSDLYARYIIDSYELEIDLDGGEIISGDITEPLKYQEEKELPIVSKTGYTFTGWEVVSGSETSVEEKVDEETGEHKHIITMGYEKSRVKATWRINTYTLTLQKDNGDPDDNLTLEYNQLYPLSNPSKTGHTFIGWTNIEKLVGGRMPAEDVTLTANYTANTYKWLVNHNIMNGTATGYDFKEAETGQGEYGTKFRGTLKNYPGFTNPPQREGTITVDKKPDDAGDPEINVLNYDYIRKSNTLTIALDGGTYSGDTIIKNVYYQQEVVLGETTKTGYDFTEWTIVGTAASVSGNTVTMGYDSATVTANWLAKNYEVTFNVNGGNALSPSSKIVTYDKGYGEVNGTLPSPTRTGYTFAGWYTDANGGTRIYDSTAVTTADNHTIYAHWTPINYTVTYNVCGGNALNPSTKTVTYDSTYGKDTNGNTALLATPTLSGYNFAGWYLGTSCSGGTRVYDTTAVKTASNHTLYAHWTGIQSTVTFNKQSGTGGSNSVTATYGSAMPSATAPTRSGYTFGGYYTSTSGSGTQYYTSSMTSARTWNRTSATTLYAKWTPLSYEVTINVVNASRSAQKINVNFDGSNTVTITPNSGYYLSSATCTTGYTTNAVTGREATGVQTLTITNKNGTTGYLGNGSCTFTAELSCTWSTFAEFLRCKPDSDTVIADDQTADHNMRFIGADPNNYYTMDGKTGRVIGVFNSNSHGYNGDLVKVVADDTFSAYWDSNGSNDWNTSSLKRTLDSGTYGTSYKVKTVTWKTGSITDSSSNAQGFYNMERGTNTSYASPYSTTSIGKVALPYMSDYFYSSSGYSGYSNTSPGTWEICSGQSASNALWQNGEFCTRGSWLTNNNTDIDWLLDVPYNLSDYAYAMQAYGDGRIAHRVKYEYNRTRPTFYLYEAVTCSNCDDPEAGTSTKPWQLSLDINNWKGSAIISTSNVTSSSSIVEVPFDGYSTVTITPASGYFIGKLNEHCTNSYTTNANTGRSATGEQTIRIYNNRSSKDSICTFNGYELAERYWNDNFSGKVYDFDNPRPSSTSKTLTNSLTSNIVFVRSIYDDWGSNRNDACVYLNNKMACIDEDSININYPCSTLEQMAEDLGFTNRQYACQDNSSVNTTQNYVLNIVNTYTKCNIQLFKSNNKWRLGSFGCEYNPGASTTTQRRCTVVPLNSPYTTYGQTTCK